MPSTPPEATVTLPEVTVASAVPARTLMLVGLGTATAFAALTAAVATHAPAVSTTDLRLHMWVLANRTDWSISVARVLTWGGATIVTLPALIVVGSVASASRLPTLSRIGAGALLATVASVGVYVGLAVNAAVEGIRPQALDWAGAAGGPSFPSGHTTAGTIFAAGVVWAAWQRLRSARARGVLLACAAAYAVVVGITRVWLGVHWPTDVAGGWLFGIAWMSLAAALFTMARHRRVVSRPC